MEPKKPAENPSSAPDAGARKYRFSAFTALLVTAGFVAGVIIGDFGVKSESGRAGVGASGSAQVIGKDSPSPLDLQDVDFAHFWEVWKMVQERHVDEPAKDIDLFYGAVAGMVGALHDPYSVYFDPEFAREFARELEGKFDGIGAEIGVKENQLTIIAPLPGTPAERAGLKAGDRIYAIDGTDTLGMAVEDAVTRIRGEKGTEVTLFVGRESFETPQEFVIRRDTIIVESVKSENITRDGKTFAHVTITHFNDNVEVKFRAAVRAAVTADVDGFILDLRNDPGGYLDTAVTVSGEWIAEDTVVLERFSDGTETRYASEGAARLADMPTVVLVNGGSASASEIVAGALQDARKAVLVGEKTFGKGSVQDYVEFDDGSALKLTVAKWYTPSGRSIDKEGITPDIEVALTPEDFEAERDPQLDRAVELLSDPAGLPTIPERPETTAGKEGNAL